MSVVGRDKRKGALCPNTIRRKWCDVDGSSKRIIDSGQTDFDRRRITPTTAIPKADGVSISGNQRSAQTHGKSIGAGACERYVPIAQMPAGAPSGGSDNVHIAITAECNGVGHHGIERWIAQVDLVGACGIDLKTWVEKSLSMNGKTENGKNEKK